ncbi:MAG: glycosyltransferase [Thermoanaerobaculia bacterium]|nr:glycosyltransferase [Thermoanaerobaculia bacterium]
MRVVVVNMTIDQVLGGGTAEKAKQLASAFARLGATSSILTTDAGLTAAIRLELAGCTVHAVPTLWRRFWVPRTLPGRLAGVVRNADAVLLLSHWTILNLGVARACLRAGVPYFVCPSGALPILGRSRVLKAAYNLLGGRRMLRAAHGVIATIDSEVTEILDYGVSGSRIRVIPNAVTSPPPPGGAATFCSERGIRSPFVLFLGRLAPIKGPDLLLAAWLESGMAARGYDLVLAGRDEGLGKSLRRKAAASGIDGHVHFVGHLDATEKARALQEATLLTIPSRREAMSQVALEAGAAGVPLLATEVCGLRLTLERGGLEVAPTVEALRDGLVALLAEPEALPGMGRRLRDRVLGEFELDAVARLYMRHFEEACGTGAGPGPPS